MDRRGFLLGLAGVLGAGATAGFALVAAAEATPLDQLKHLAPSAPAAAATPDGTVVEDAQYWGPPGPPRGYWRRRYRRRRRRVCGWRRDRWGRPFRNCWYTWR